MTKTLIRDGVVVRGGNPFARGSLAYLLRNRFYIGELSFKGAVHAAERPAILDRALFEAVQARLTEQRVGKPRTRGRSSALLIGKLFDDRGNVMSPSHANKGGVRYRYYVSRPLLDGHPADAGSVRRVSASEIDTLVLDTLRTRSLPGAADQELVAAVERVEVGAETIRIGLEVGGMGEGRSDPDRATASDLIVPWRPKSSRRHRNVIAVASSDAPVRPMRVETRATLLGAIARGRRWQIEILSGKVAGPDAIGHREGCSRRQITATLSLAHLAPDIVEAAIAGRLPHGIALRNLTDLPIAWSEQRRALGLGG